MRVFKKMLVMATFATVVIAGCSKDSDTPDPVVPPTKKELLTAKTWQIGESYQSVSGTRIHYLKGGENTTGVDMGKLRTKFNTDGTGSHTDTNGIVYTLTWAFTTPDEKNIHINIGGAYLFDWYFVDIEADAVLASSNVSTNGLTTSKWIPVP